MNSTMTLGLLAALGVGIAVGFQGIFTSIIGQSIGPLRGGVAIHIGGTIAGFMMLFAFILTSPNQPSIVLTPQTALFAFLAGVIGMFIVMGIAYSFPIIGQVSGQASIIFAQLTVGVIVDMFAIAGGQPIPLDARRILGLVVLAIGTYLLLPPQNS